ncbi:MAG: hypothetical protein WA869_24645, partial [Alloacidobacterium sp.]
SLIEPEPYLLLIFGILRLRLLLRPGRDSQEATAQHRKRANYVPLHHPPTVEPSTRLRRAQFRHSSERNQDFQCGFVDTLGLPNS